MDGLLLIDKPVGPTSHDVVDAVRRIAKTRRVGHAGTLDPFASGLLILGINRGTKALTHLVGLNKSYRATARLGATSTTDDTEGEVTEREIDHIPSREEIEEAFDQFKGGYLQTAPAYSAKKVGGKKLYELARQGKADTVERPKKEVKIFELNIDAYNWPSLTFTVTCSSGTYIRALARDVGEALHVGAYLTDLRRTRIGTYEVEQSVKPSDLTGENFEQYLLQIENPPK